MAIENTQPHQSIENNEGVIYNVEIENTIKNMEKDKTGFFKTHHGPQRGWMFNDYPIEMSGRTEVEINDNKYNITPGLQKVFTDTTYDAAKSMKDTEKLVFRDNLQKTG